jgi:hypothetical protein
MELSLYSLHSDKISHRCCFTEKQHSGIELNVYYVGADAQNRYHFLDIRLKLVLHEMVNYLQSRLSSPVTLSAQEASKSESRASNHPSTFGAYFLSMCSTCDFTSRPHKGQEFSCCTATIYRYQGYTCIWRIMNAT